MFWSRLNHNIQLVPFCLVFRIMEISSTKSPYFVTKSTEEKCQTMSSRLANKRQTRSTIEKQPCKVKLEPETTNENCKVVKKVRKEVVLSLEENLEKKTWMPENWKTVLDNIREMRAARDAPVDQMGAEQCADQTTSPQVKRFQVLVSLMLSSQTKDQITFEAMQKLRKHGLTIENIINTEEDVIAKLIHPVGFWKKKASFIKRTAQMLAEKYNNDIPQTVEELCTLPGVGQKMAVLTVNIGWEKIVGIGVDTHVHRIANRLGWTRSPTKTPEQTQKELEDWLPSTLWDEVNVLLVGFGQQQCTPVKPHCTTCLIKNLCPVGKSQIERKN